MKAYEGPLTLLIIILVFAACENNSTTLREKSAPISSPGNHLYFHGYKCTKDCSGHQAGYRWAEKKNISNYEGCTGYSRSFIEGCHAYVEEFKDKSGD